MGKVCPFAVQLSPLPCYFIPPLTLSPLVNHLFLGAVFLLSRHADMQDCERRMTELIDFVKEQSSSYVQYNETAVAKALVRETTAVQELDGVTLDCGEDELRQYVERLGLTGISVLDVNGRLVCEYSADSIGYTRLQTDLEAERVLAVIGHPQSTYVRRVQLTDGSFADAAVRSCADGRGAVLGWRHTEAAFAKKSVLSVQNLLDGYDAETTGTVLLSDGNRVTASDEPSLIGTDTTENDLLRRIRSSGHADRLVYAGRRGLTRYYGMYSHGRNFYYYMVDVEKEDVVADPMRLNQIMLNILSNAIKFTPVGGMITLRIVQKQTAPHGSVDYEFHIRDTGIGMSSAFQEHIFEQFAREETSTVSKIQGTGLGMAITKNLVDMMGGRISVESEPGKGSEFTVSLRFPISGEQAVPRRIPQLEGLRALVADDDTNTCLNVSKMLRMIGMRSDWTTSGHEAVVRTQDAIEQGDGFDVFIIDWMIPDLNGLEVVRRIRRLIGSNTPIIILTAYDWADIEVEAKAAGVTAFCAKPLFMSELRRILAEPFLPAEAAEQTEKKADFAGKRLLVVEDNALNREIAVTMLEEGGFEVDTAENGKVAVDKVRESAPGYYDLVLMDIQMPIMDGYAAARAIRALPNAEKAGLPIVAMTANAFDEDRQNAEKAGMNGHLSKPFDMQQLLTMLREKLSP